MARRREAIIGDPTLVEFGVRLTHYRRQRGMSQSKLAKHCGLTRASIANIEAGRQNCSVLTLIDMAGALNVIPGALLGGHPGNTKPEWVADVRHEERKRLVEAVSGYLTEYMKAEGWT